MSYRIIPLEGFEATFVLTIGDSQTSGRLSLAPAKYLQYYTHTDYLGDLVVAEVFFNSFRLTNWSEDYFDVSELVRVNKELEQLRTNGCGEVHLYGVENVVILDFSLTSNGVFSVRGHFPGSDYYYWRLQHDPGLPTKMPTTHLTFEMQPPVVQLENWIAMLTSVTRYCSQVERISEEP